MDNQMDNQNELTNSPNSEQIITKYGSNNNQQNNYAQQNNYYTPQNNNYVPQNNNFIPNSIIESLSGWLKFLGICTIIYGAFTCIGIITAAIGVPLILAGIALTKASKSLKNYLQYNNPYTLNEIFESLNKYFKVKGILAIVYIVFIVIYIVFLVFIAVMSFNGIFQNY